jgi:hypothetical protein
MCWFQKKCEVVHDFWAFFVQTSHWKYMSNLTCSLFISRMWILLQLHLQISFRRTEPTGFFWGSVTIFHRKRLLKIRCDIFMGYKNHGIVLPSGNLLHSYWKWLFVVDFPINSMVIFHSYVGLPKGRIPKGIPLDSMYSWNAGSLTVFCETHCTRHPKVFQTYMPVEIKRCCCCLYPSHFFGANLVGLHLPLFWCCWHFLSQLIQASIVIHRQLHRCFWSKSRRNPFPR